MVSFPSQPLYSRRNNTGYPLNRKLDRLQSPYGHFGEKKKDLVFYQWRDKLEVDFRELSSQIVNWTIS